MPSRFRCRAAIRFAGLYAAGADSVSMGGGSYAGASANIGPAMTFGHIAARDIGAS